MTELTRIPGRPDWAAGPLYNKLLEVFPQHRTTLGVLDVQKLKVAVKKSHEAIYKWFRNGKLTPDNARAIVKAANDEDNVAALAEIGREPPTFEDFVIFL